MRSGLELREIGARQFLADLDALTEIYQAAMDPPAEQLPGRSSIMERHAGYGSFRAVVAAQPGHGPAAQPSHDPAAQPSHDPAAQPSHDPAAWRRGNAGAKPAPTTRLVGFAYGFHGAPGQWWHDLVHEVVASKHGVPAADEWLGDSFEIAEVHVHPRHQGRGAGRAMMLRLTAGRPERTAVLSTMDADSRARRLYRGLGFDDLVAGFIFPGTDLPYAVMGAALPLQN
jgi:ribosomal protein S18 acetylase RimI-like enzyme